MDRNEHARAELAKIDDKLARLDAGKPVHKPNDGGLTQSLERDRSVWSSVIASYS